MYSSASAQHVSDALTYGGGGNGDPDPNGWGITASGGYDATTGSTRSTYGGAPTFSLGLIKNLNDFTFNATIGYVSYKPKMDTAFIYVDNATVGYIHYNNLSSLEIYVGAAYNVQIADEAKLYFGLNIGSYYNDFEYDANTIAGEFANNSSGQTEYIGPKIGVNLILSNHFAFGIEGRYNVEFGSSKSSVDTGGYGYSISSIKTFTASGALTYYF